MALSRWKPLEQESVALLSAGNLHRRALQPQPFPPRPGSSRVDVNLDESLHAAGLAMTSRVSGAAARETFMSGRAIQIVVDVAIIAGAIVSLALLALAFLFD
jgi:hypothetical protein